MVGNAPCGQMGGLSATRYRGQVGGLNPPCSLGQMCGLNAPVFLGKMGRLSTRRAFLCTLRGLSYKLFSRM
jgi:hypothetical protein